MAQVSRLILSGAKIWSDHQWLQDKALVVEGKAIRAIIDHTMIAHHLPAKQYTFSAQHYLVPGFIDLHIHGAQGHDVMDGTFEALQSIAAYLPSEGVTGFLATTMTSTPETLETVLKLIPNAQTKIQGAALLGVHLEGPFIAKSRCGAQCAEHVLTPDLGLFTHWQTLAKNLIKIITLAPELDKDFNFIKAMREREIIASIGHTNATFEETQQAILNGASYATHLFNAMPTMHQREPGAALALLLSHNVMAELILDEHHLHPSMVQLAYQLKTAENLLLVSDAMRAKCLSDGTYSLGGQDVSVVQGKAQLANGTLAGSTLCLPDAIKRFQQITQAELGEVINLVSENPARILNLQQTKGSITIGHDADLVVLNEDLAVQLTLREGEIVYAKSS